jgi:hypothetical protein
MFIVQWCSPCNFCEGIQLLSFLNQITGDQMLWATRSRLILGEGWPKDISMGICSVRIIVGLWNIGRYGGVVNLQWLRLELWYTARLAGYKPSNESTWSCGISADWRGTNWAVTSLPTVVLPSVCYDLRCCTASLQAVKSLKTQRSLFYDYVR